MRLKLYRARTVTEAMSQVRAELGAEALILGTRQFLDSVEVTAALEPPDLDTTLLAARGCTPAFAFHAVPERLRGPLGRGGLAQALAGVLTFGALPMSTHPLLLSGPPGAGKTLTLVRLATRLVLAGQAPTVISTDHQKAGAAEQLRAFMRLLGVPLTGASDAVALSRVLAPLAGTAPVLIDTPGTDPFDRNDCEMLRALASGSGAEIVLVLPAGLDTAEAADTAQAYMDAGARFLIATRLDLSRRLGGILAAADAGRLILTEAGVGPDAASGLVPLTPEFLAGRLAQTGTPRHAI